MEILCLDREFVDASLPKRELIAHKGNFGRILLLCGSKGYSGAAALAAMGALRSGAGLVYLGVPESIYTIEAIKLNEAIVFPLPDEDGAYSINAIEPVLRKLDAMDAVLIGPGIGQKEGAAALLIEVLKRFKGPIVLDADGINLLVQHKYVLRERTYPTILTPHSGEFARIANVSGNRIADAVSFANDFGVIVVLKGHRTVVTDGNTVYVNNTGNPGMAVGGSGDVLAGIIVSLIGQGISPLKASASGVWLHGKAGDLCADEIGQYGMLPTDMLHVLPRLMK